MSKKIKLFTMALLCFSAVVSAQKTVQKTTAKRGPAIVKAANLSYILINSENNTFGYNIYQNGALLIHQPNIPALPGNNGFATKLKAAKVARLVISKIIKGEMPPAVTEMEMKKLGAIQ